MFASRESRITVSAQIFTEIRCQAKHQQADAHTTTRRYWVLGFIRLFSFEGILNREAAFANGTAVLINEKSASSFVIFRVISWIGLS